MTKRSMWFVAVAVGVVAVLLLLGPGVASSADTTRNKDEVGLTMLMGGPIQTDRSDVETPIPISNASFTQRAGEVVLVVGRLNAVPGPETNFCNLRVVLTDSTDSGGVGLIWESSTNKGEFGETTEAESLPAPASDTPRTLTAFAMELGCDGPDEDNVVRNDTFTVSLVITIVTLRA